MAEPDSSRGSVAEVFRVFLVLGLTSFGGPIAHLGYYRRELVERRRWVNDSQFIQIVALCQFLPGPSSSQVGFCLGLVRAGFAGALAGALVFIAPSAVLLFAFAAVLPAIEGPMGDAAIHGLKLVALAVVSHGVLGMRAQLCPDPARMSIAALAAAVILLTEPTWVQLLAVLAGGLAGLVLCREVRSVGSAGAVPLDYGAGTGWRLLAVFAVLLLALPWLAGLDPLLAAANAFYRTGSLVFGGGHVVLPLLEDAVVTPGWIDRDDFLAGYGAAQAVPGPMFSISAFLGARLPGEAGGAVGALVALVAIFLPGYLLVAGMLPLWRAIVARPVAARVVAGVNAAVVGLLGAALYDPLWTSAVRGATDVVIALVGFTAFAAWRVSALWVVAWCVLASMAAAL